MLLGLRLQYHKMMKHNDNISIVMPILKKKQKNKLRFLDDQTLLNTFLKWKKFFGRIKHLQYHRSFPFQNQLFAEGINYIVTLQTYTSISSKVLKQIVEVVISM